MTNTKAMLTIERITEAAEQHVNDKYPNMEMFHNSGLADFTDGAVWAAKIADKYLSELREQLSALEERLSEWEKAPVKTKKRA